MISKRLLSGLVAAALGLPICILVLLALGRLLSAMGDDGGAMVLRRVGQLGGAVWVLSMVGLLIALAVARLNDEASREDVDLERLEDQ